MNTHKIHNLIGILAGLQGLQGQQDQSALVKQQLQQQQDSGPLESDLMRQKIAAMMHENSPEVHNLQEEVLRNQAQRYGNDLPDILQAGGYLQDPKLMDYILRKKGYLGDDFNRGSTLSPDAQMLKDKLSGEMQKRNIQLTH